MSAISEFLNDEELAQLIGRKTASKQIDWLSRRGWRFEINAAGRPVMGRVYARLKLAGVRPDETNSAQEQWSFDLSKVS